MCGIAGGLNLPRERLERMLQLLHHRGPDAQTSVQIGTTSLGTARLAILDREQGHQPFRSSCGQITAICNGELYNWLELRYELEARGHRFTTRCDCEILPAAWLEWGHSLPEKINGMFAFAIHDKRTNTLFLARDRCGQKPLYYTSRGNFLFASEVKALSAANVSLQPDPAHLSTWLSLRYLPEPATMFKDIITLPAAHWMTVSPHGDIQLQRYWEPQPHSNIEPQKSTRHPLDNLDQLTRSSVELALQAEVPVAAYLSGGVDSALLAHYLKDLEADFTTISIGFGAGSDESQAAQTTANRLGLSHHSSILEPESLENLPRIIRQMDRPIGDALILAFDHLACHTSSLGCKVALGGEGPDEHFGGYSFQKAFLLARQLGPLGRSLAATTCDNMPNFLLDRFANFPANLCNEGQAKVSRYLREFSSLPFFHQATRLHTLFEPSEIKELIHPDLHSAQVTHPIESSSMGKDPLSSLLALQYQHWLPDWSLIRQDKNAMKHSVEYRAPFLDHRLIDFAFTLPKRAKISGRQDKHIWRQLAARHLPSSITQRPKQPFYLPLEHPSWREPLLQLARETLAPDRLEQQGWIRPTIIKSFLEGTSFLPLKKLAALIILQLWREAAF